MSKHQNLVSYTITCETISGRTVFTAEKDINNGEFWVVSLSKDVSEAEKILMKEIILDVERSLVSKGISSLPKMIQVFFSKEVAVEEFIKKWCMEKECQFSKKDDKFLIKYLPAA